MKLKAGLLVNSKTVIIFFLVVQIESQPGTLKRNRAYWRVKLVGIEIDCRSYQYVEDLRT
jgi:hypothetical protein